MVEKHILSKSSFLRGLQCPKSLYLYKNSFKKKDPPSPEQQAIFERGTVVGKIARRLFPNGVDATPSSVFKYADSVELTRDLIAKKTPVIYEAAFQADKTLVAMDILVLRDNNHYEAFEVKSSARVTPQAIMDAALQFYIIQAAGIDLCDISILTVNSSYVRKEELNYAELFTQRSVMTEVLHLQSQIKENLVRLLEVAQSKTMPEVEIDRHCFSPYPCDFIGTCFKDIPQNSVLNLGGTAKEELFNLYYGGIKTIQEIPADYPFAKNLRLQIDHFGQHEPVIDHEGLKKFLDTLEYPMYFMDFETIMPPVPFFKGTSPYQPIPFQFSLHFKETANSEATHIDFLAEAGADPRKDFIKALLNATRIPGIILTYNVTFERTVLQGLKQDFKAYADEIDYLIYRLKDLMIPFENKSYYHSAMKGSHSIKNVLPALIPELNYDHLKINAGAMAMATFELLQNETDLFKIAESRDALKEYCKMDTLAMVKMLEVLEKKVK